MKTFAAIIIGIVLIAIIAFVLHPPTNRDKTLIPNFDDLGTNAVPQLVQFLTTNQFHPKQNQTQTRSSIRMHFACENAMRALSRRGTNAETAMPILIDYLKSGESTEQSTAAETLAIVGRNRKNILIPVLMQTLTNSTGYARISVADALASFGNDARPALPFLIWASQHQRCASRYCCQNNCTGNAERARASGGKLKKQ